MLRRISFLGFISENVSHSQIASSPFLRDDNKIPNFTPPQIEEKDKSNSSLSTAGESDANDVSIMVCLYAMKEKKAGWSNFTKNRQDVRYLHFDWHFRHILGDVRTLYESPVAMMCLDQPIDFLQIPITVTFKFGEITASMKGKWIWRNPTPYQPKFYSPSYNLVCLMWLIDLSPLLGENRKESQILTCQTLYSSRRMQKIIKTKIRFVGKSNTW